MTLRFDVETVQHDLERPFTIARGTTTTASMVEVTVTDGHGVTGRGLAAPAARYGENVETVRAALDTYIDAVHAVDDPAALAAIETAMRDRLAGNPAARAAVSIALHDRWARTLEEPLYRLWGYTPEAVATSFTLGIDEPAAMAEHARAAVEAGHEILKVKLGTSADRAVVQAVREAVPGAALRVDANEAWGRKEAVAMCRFLAEHDVAFVEQPVPADDDGALRFVTERSPLPIAADESCVTPADVPAVARSADIANVKLMKCGGLVAARRMIHAAHAHGLGVMLGCMAENHRSIAAGAHLAPAVEYADLDGALLLADDPYKGPVRPDGSIVLDPSAPGTGVRPRG